VTQPQYYQPQYPPQGYPAGYGQPYQQPQPNGGAPLGAPTPQLAAGGGGGGSGTPTPRMRHLAGCTIVIIPKRVDENAMNNFVTPPQPRPDAYFDLIVVDSPRGVIQYGDNQDKLNPKPLAWEIATPAYFPDCRDYGWAPVNEVRNALAEGQPGRVGVVEAGKTAYLITKPDQVVDGKPGSRPDGAERFARASQVWDAIFNGRFTNPAPRSLIAAPAQPQQQVAYGQPQPAQQYPYGGAGVPQGYAVQAPAQPYPQSAPQAQSTPPAPAGYPQGYGQFAPPQPSPFTQAMAQEPQPAASPFDAYIASLPPDQQAAARQQFAMQQGLQPPAAAAGPGI